MTCRKETNFCKGAGVSAAFTLIELMVVIAVIGILIGGVFKLLSLAGASTQRAETVARIERVQNALSGFYAEFGTYPPVRRYGSPDPYMEEDDNGGAYNASSTLESENANRAAASQPVAFLYPHARSMDDYIGQRYQTEGIMGVNDAFNNSIANRDDTDWDEVRIFQFGLMSFLLPRIALVTNGSDLNSLAQTDNNIPQAYFFDTKQWKEYNASTVEKSTSGGWWGKLKDSLAAQQQRENHAVARWLPNLEKSVCGGPSSLLGINTLEPGTGLTFSPQVDPKSSGIKYMLAKVTIRDGWGHDLYYYSMPPYQSYRLWSAGPDNKTFPPWISLESLPSKDRVTVSGWLKDDIARFDRSR